MARAVVIGAGAAGLTTAVVLGEAGHQVEVWAREMGPRITSAAAAAVWYPLRGERDARADAWMPVSFERFNALASEPRTGIMLRGGIELFREPADDTWWREVLPGFRHARADELPPGFADGFVSDGIPVIEMPVYLEWLAARVSALGGRIVTRAARDLAEAAARAPVVVNCAGLGARELAKDATVRAVRGQVVWVEQVGVERYVLDEANPAGVTYLYPRARDIVLGGTREPDAESLEPDPPTAEAIVARCAALDPRILRAGVLAHRVGLRPTRPSVRLEAERMGDALVVHNYGHGGSGVTLSWGCAAEVLTVVDGHARR